MVGELDNASDELKAKFSEFFDLYITVCHRKINPRPVESKIASAYQAKILDALRLEPNVDDSGNPCPHIVTVDGDALREIDRFAVELEKRIFLEGYYSAISFTSGGCRLCEECNIEEGLCVKPMVARPSMESCGISVFDTANNVGYKLKVLDSKEQEFFRYGLVLIH